MYRILIIEDHPNLANGVERFLGLHIDGCFIAKAQSGNASLALLAEKVFDIVLLDINLPDVNGIDLCGRILSEWQQTKIIAISGMMDTKSVKGIMEAGASGYILKTSLAEDLLTGIKAVMKGESFLSSGLPLIR